MDQGADPTRAGDANRDSLTVPSINGVEANKLITPKLPYCFIYYKPWFLGISVLFVRV